MRATKQYAKRALVFKGILVQQLQYRSRMIQNTIRTHNGQFTFTDKTYKGSQKASNLWIPAHQANMYFSLCRLLFGGRSLGRLSFVRVVRALEDLEVP